MISLKKKKEEKKSLDLSKMSVEEIIKAKEDVEALLASLEDEYRNASISEENYKDVKQKNEKKLEEIKAVLRDMGMGDIADRPPKTTSQGKPEETSPKAGNQVLGEAERPKQTVIQTVPRHSVNMELIESRIKMEIEKFKALLDAFKESRAATDERIQRLTESVGEIRSMVFQREAGISELEMKIDKLEEMVKSIDPIRIEKEFGKRDKTITEYDIRIEKLERKTSDMLKTISEIQSLLKSMGSLENIAEVNKDIAKKRAEIRNMEKNMERLVSRVQKIYVDMNKKMEEFLVYKSKQEALEELVKDIMKNLDDIIIKSENFVTAENIKTLKEDIYGLASRISEVKKTLDFVVPLVKLKIPEHIRKLQKTKEDIETLLHSLEESYQRGAISKSEYVSTRMKNIKRLKKIERQLKREWEKIREGVVPEEGEDKKQGEEKPEHKEKHEVKTEKKKQEEKNEQKEEKKEGQKNVQEQKKEQIIQNTNEDDILKDLEESYKTGLISKEAYEKAKKLVKGGG